MEFQKNFIWTYLIYNLSVSNDISGDARKDYRIYDLHFQKFPANTGVQIEEV